ncbi:MAG: metallophosphoesterase [Nitrospirae bacterium]|nr:metallophosphoesterase [Nitrospirota bacterium]
MQKDGIFSGKKGIPAVIDRLLSKDCSKEEASSYLEKQGKNAVPTLIEALQKKEENMSSNKHGYIALVLAEIGAKGPIPALISSFPALEISETVVIVDTGDIANWGIVNYRVLERWIDRDPDKVPALHELKTRYGKYLNIINFEHYYAKYYLENYKMTDIIENYKINFVLQAGAYALSKITGEDFGTNREEWQEWWEKNKVKYNMPATDR